MSATDDALRTGSSMRHVPALDGLRGVAILLVLLHGFDVIDATHGPARVTEVVLNVGWIGVQLFFVLSGFLITGILLDSRASPDYYRSFFVRRVLRIFPLYYGVLFIAFVLLPWLLPDMGGSGRHQIWLWTYLANFTAPFGNSEATFPNFWSLCVEEQFYLVWPFVVLHAGRKTLVAVSAMLVVIGLCSRVYLRHRFGEPLGHEIAYMFTPCRMDALAVGAISAVLVRGSRSSAWLARVGPGLLAGGGFALLAIAMLSGRFARTGVVMQDVGYSLVAFGFALLLLATLTPSALPARLLDSAFLRRCGTYSYGMYVFYAPLHILVGAPLLDHYTDGERFTSGLLYEVVAIGVTFCLAALSYRLYEVRFLALKSRFAPVRAA